MWRRAKCAGLWVVTLGLCSAAPQDAPSSAGRGWDSIPVFVWRLANSGQPLSDELVTAFGGVNVEGSAKDDWAREKGLDFYVGHGPGRNDLHIDSERPWYAEMWQAYWNDRDPSRLIREPCLSDASTLDSLCQSLAASMRARDGDCGLGVSLGDEVSLTPWGSPLDLCESKACRTAFAEFMRDDERWTLPDTAEGSALPYPDTDTTRLAWIEGDPRHVGPWLARRDFHHRVFTGTLRRLASRARELSPQVPVGLFGQSGRTAFGDVGVEEVLEFVDFLEVYRVLDSRELLYTLRGEDQRSLLTLFREEQAPDGAAWIAWEHWLRGGDGFVLWSDEDLESHPDYFDRTRAAIADLRGVKQRIPEWRPEPSGVALIHDPDSLTLAWLRDALNDGPTWMRRFASFQHEHGSREVSLRALLRLLEDVGFTPGALPLDRVQASTVRRFPVLVANHLLLLEDEHRARLAEYLEAGGRLIMVGDFATFDRHGRRRGDPGKERLPANCRERAHTFDIEPQRYLEERWARRGGDAYASRLGRELASLCAPAQQQGLPWAVVSKDFRGPWLRAMQPGKSSGHWLCAALPNATLAGERKQLEHLTVGIEGIGEGRIEWIHPLPMSAEHADQVRLRPGDALVFRIVEP